MDITHHHLIDVDADGGLNIDHATNGEWPLTSLITWRWKWNLKKWYPDFDHSFVDGIFPDINLNHPLLGDLYYSWSPHMKPD